MMIVTTLNGKSNQIIDHMWMCLNYAVFRFQHVPIYHSAEAKATGLEKEGEWGISTS